MPDPMEQLMNKAWEKMSKTLDDELPQSKTVNFHVYKYSAIVSFLLFSVSVLWLFLNQNTINTNRQTEMVNAQIRELKTKAQSQGYPEINKNGTSVSENFVIRSSDVRNHSNITELMINKSEKRTTNQIIAQLPLSNKNILIAQTKNEILTDRSFDNLPIEYDEDGNISEENSSSKRQQTKFKHNTLSVSVNSVNQNFSSFEGINGGINYSYKLNKNFGFMTGIEHSMYSKNRFEYDLGNLHKAYFQRTAATEERESSTNEIAQNSNPGMNYYLGIPLGLMYSIDKFTLSAGIKFSYLLNSMSRPGSNSNDNRQVMALIRNISTENEEGINKFDYSFIFAFEIHVLKDLSVFSRLNYSQARIVNSYSYNENPVGDLFIVSGLEGPKDKPENNIYFGLGIKYDIAKK